MIEVMKDLPPHIIGFRVTGKVSKYDYETVLMPTLNEFSKTHNKLNLILLLETNVSNYSLGAWVDDILVGLKHLTKWHRVAIVSQQDVVKKITDIFGHLFPGEYKGFKNADLETAKKWVADK